MAIKHTAFDLTRREEEVLACILKGYESQEIANELGLALGTVRVYVQTILEKFGVKSKFKLVAQKLQEEQNR